MNTEAIHAIERIQAISGLDAIYYTTNPSVYFAFATQDNLRDFVEKIQDLINSRYLIQLSNKPKIVESGICIGFTTKEDETHVPMLEKIFKASIGTEKKPKEIQLIPINPNSIVQL